MANNTIDIDELNIFFSGIELPKAAIDRRKKLATAFYDEMIGFFLWVDSLEEPDAEEIKVEAYIRFGDALRKFGGFKPKFLDDNEDTIMTCSNEIADTTISGFGQEFTTSDRRAFLIAVNEALSFVGLEDYQKALARNGDKTWHTKDDELVRPTHAEVNMRTIPVDEYFVVGGELMRFPHDPLASAKETANCRCWATYT